MVPTEFPTETHLLCKLRVMSLVMNFKRVYYKHKNGGKDKKHFLLQREHYAFSSSLFSVVFSSFLFFLMELNSFLFSL